MSPHPPRRLWLKATSAGAAALASPFARAQSGWPNRPVNIIVPFPSGGGTDAFARPWSAALTRALGKQMIIDNRGGAGGTLGATLAAKSAPDGYTFFMGAVHHAIAPAMCLKLDDHIETDFIPVGRVSNVPQVIGVHPQRVPATDLKGPLDHLRKNPAKLNCGSAGNDTSHHLAGELFELQTKSRPRCARPSPRPICRLPGRAWAPTCPSSAATPSAGSWAARSSAGPRW